MTWQFNGTVCTLAERLTAALRVAGSIPTEQKHICMAYMKLVRVSLFVFVIFVCLSMHTGIIPGVRQIKKKHEFSKGKTYDDINISTDRWLLISLLLHLKKTPLSKLDCVFFSDAQKRVCKNIVRIQRGSFKMFTCGLFTIDAVLPLRLTALITTYTIVILQFEFL